MPSLSASSPPPPPDLDAPYRLWDAAAAPATTGGSNSNGGGGGSGSGSGSDHSGVRVEELVDPAVRPDARFGHTATRDGHHVFVFGGVFLDGHIPRHRNDLWRLSCREWAWARVRLERAAAAPTPRSGHSASLAAAAASAGGARTLYVFGGCGNNGELNDTHALDLAAVERHFLRARTAIDSGGGGGSGATAADAAPPPPPPPLLDAPRWERVRTRHRPPPRRAGHSAALFDGKYLVVHGGRAPQGQLNDTWILHLATRAWVEVEVRSPPPPRWLHASCVLDNQLYVFGGGELRGHSVVDTSAIYAVPLRELVHKSHEGAAAVAAAGATTTAAAASPQTSRRSGAPRGAGPEWGVVEVSGAVPPPRRDAALCAHGAHGFFVHGGAASSAVSASPAGALDDAFFFDAKRRYWARLRPAAAAGLLPRRSGHVGVLLDGALLLVGGRVAPTATATATAAGAEGGGGGGSGGGDDPPQPPPLPTICALLHLASTELVQAEATAAADAVAVAAGGQGSLAASTSLALPPPPPPPPPLRQPSADGGKRRVPPGAASIGVVAERGFLAGKLDYRVLDRAMVRHHVEHEGRLLEERHGLDAAGCIKFSKISKAGGFGTVFRMKRLGNVLARVRRNLARAHEPCQTCGGPLDAVLLPCGHAAACVACGLDAVRRGDRCAACGGCVLGVERLFSTAYARLRNRVVVHTKDEEDSRRLRKSRVTAAAACDVGRIVCRRTTVVDAAGSDVVAAVSLDHSSSSSSDGSSDGGGGGPPGETDEQRRRRRQRRRQQRQQQRRRQRFLWNAPPNPRPRYTEKGAFASASCGGGEGGRTLLVPRPHQAQQEGGAGMAVIGAESGGKGASGRSLKVEEGGEDVDAAAAPGCERRVAVRIVPRLYALRNACMAQRAAQSVSNARSLRRTRCSSALLQQRPGSAVAAEVVEAGEDVVGGGGASFKRKSLWCTNTQQV